MNCHCDFIRCALYFNCRDTRFFICGANDAANLYIFMQELGIVLLSVPATTPVLNYAEPESVRMNLLPQSFLLNNNCYVAEASGVRAHPAPCARAKSSQVLPLICIGFTNPELRRSHLIVVLGIGCSRFNHFSHNPS